MKSTGPNFQNVFGQETWYIPADPDRIGEAFCFPAGTAVGGTSELLDCAKRIQKKVSIALEKLSGSHSSEEDFFVEFTPKEDNVQFPLRLRVHVEHATAGGVMYVVRYTHSGVADLDDLLTGSNQVVKEVLLSRELNQGGIILFAGAAGNGRTTLASAAVCGRLKKFGGICVSAEDPPEIPMHGRHGEGLCIQTELRKTEVYGQRLKAIMRAYPGPSCKYKQLFIGEIRDKDGAMEALTASLNGLLVLGTIHAGSPGEAVERLARLAHESKIEAGLHTLATSLRVSLFQRLEQGPTERKVLKTTPLVCNSESIAAQIKEGKFKQLDDTARMQQARMKVQNGLEFKDI